MNKMPEIENSRLILFNPRRRSAVNLGLIFLTRLVFDLLDFFGFFGRMLKAARLSGMTQVVDANDWI